MKMFRVTSCTEKKGEVMNTCQHAPITKATATMTPPLFPKVKFRCRLM